MHKPKLRLPALGLSAVLALTPFGLNSRADSIALGGPHQEGHARPPLHLNLTPATSGSYSPAQIRHAYGFDQLSTTGAGQTIGIVDAYGSPSIQNDLNTFCSQFGLPAANLSIIGGASSADSNWALETSLDVEWAHAIAPNANIILSIAPSNNLGDLLNAVDAAVKAGATVVSMSWGSGEFSGQTSYEYHFNVPGVTFTASSGDNGAGVEWPAASPYVIGVGGTSLYLDSSGNRTSAETAWSGSGGGTSSIDLLPGFQVGWITAGGRCVPDVSYVADPGTGMLVFNAGAWYVVGGTSAGAPQWAALVALCNSMRSSGTLSAANTDIYPIAQGSTVSPYGVNGTYFYDVSQGGNGYSAAPPYDLATGLGSPFANQLVPALAGSGTQTATDFGISVSPSSQSVNSGTSASYSVSVSGSGGFGGTVSLSLSGLPSGSSYSFSPSTITGSGSSTLTVSAPAGTHTLTITGGSGSLVHSTAATLNVIGTSNPDFSLSVSPGSRGVKRGNSTTYTVTISSSGGFNGTVGLAVTGYPSGTGPTFSPTQIVGSGTSTLTITTSTSSPRGTFSLTISGSSGSLTHSANVNLTLK